MNILIANTHEFHPQIGGVERISSCLVTKFIKLGHNVIFVSNIKSGYGNVYQPAAEQYFLLDDNYLSEQNEQLFVHLVKRNNNDIIMNQAGNVFEFTSLCGKIKKRCNIILLSVIHINPMNAINQLYDLKYTPLRINSYLKALIRMLLLPYRRYNVWKREHMIYINFIEVSDKVVLLSCRYKKELKNLIKKKISLNKLDKKTSYYFRIKLSTANKSEGKTK